MSYSKDKVAADLWQRATIVPDYDPDSWRQDFAGAWIQRDQLGLTTEYGWDVCHIKPRSEGGSDELSNLVAIHWRNHLSKANSFPVFKTVVTSEGPRNVEKERIWKIGK